MHVPGHEGFEHDFPEDPQKLLADSADLLHFLDRRDQIASVRTDDDTTCDIKPYYMNNADAGLHLGMWKIETDDMTARLSMVPVYGDDERQMTFDATVSHFEGEKPQPATPDELQRIAGYVSRASQLWHENMDAEPDPPRRRVAGRAIRALLGRKRHIDQEH